MSLDLVVANAITSGTLVQTVADQNQNASALSLAEQEVQVNGQDVIGGTLPLRFIGHTEGMQFGSNTWGRILRLENNGGSGRFYDLGIDEAGNFFINTPASTDSDHALVISPDGTVTIKALGSLQLSGLSTPPPGVQTVDVVVDPSTGTLYKQS